MSSQKTSSAKLRLIVGLAIVIATVTLLVFAPVRQNRFLNWDDQSYVTQNDYVQGGLTKAGIVWAFTSSHSANWHPLTWISHMVDVALFGMNPTGHHTTNLVLPAVNAALLFLLVHTLTGSVWRSALVAALFAFHPLRVESVAWVAERKDVLSTFFGLLSLMAYTNYSKSKVEGRKSKVAYALAFLFLALGLMSKPMLVTWPFVMLLLDFWPLQRIPNVKTSATPHPTLSPTEAERANTWTRLALEKLPFLGLAVVSSIVTVMAQQRGGAVASLEHLPLGLRLQNAAVAYVEYLCNFFWPTNLSPIYQHPTHIELWRVQYDLAILSSVTELARTSRRHST